jgi:hypothetical protein
VKHSSIAHKITEGMSINIESKYKNILFFQKRRNSEPQEAYRYFFKYIHPRQVFLPQPIIQKDLRNEIPSNNSISFNIFIAEKSHTSLQ